MKQFIDNHAINRHVARVEQLKLYPLPMNYMVCIDTGQGVIQFNPVNDWAQAGPLIQKYRVGLECRGRHWEAYIPYICREQGDTPLRAAMLAIITAYSTEELLP